MHSRALFRASAYHALAIGSGLHFTQLNSHLALCLAKPFHACMQKSIVLTLPL